MDASSIRSLYLQHCKPTHMLLEHGERDVSRLCEVLKAFLQDKARGVVQSAGGRAILVCYGSDATPLLTFHTEVSEHAGHKVQRRAHKADELLIEIAFVKTTDADGSPVLAFLTRDPVPLTEGKKQWNMAIPLLKFFPLVQQLGHKGIVVTSYVFDRLAQSSMSRIAFQRHAVYHLKVADEEDNVLGSMPDLLDWPVSTACANHDLQNALKWGLKLICADQADVHKKLYIVVSSYRNSFDLLFRYLPDWAALKLHFQERIVDEATHYQFWLDMGVECIVAEQIAELGLGWESGRLVVDIAHRGKDFVMSQVLHVLKSLLKFKKFSDSRWVTMGISSGAVSLCHVVGLGELVKTIRADPPASDYYLHGAGEYTKDVQVYGTVAAVVSKVVDNLLVSLLEDDRVALRLEELKEIASDEMEWIAGLSAYTWERLASGIEDCTPGFLRSSCLTVASSILCFMKHRVFNVAEELPWSLVRGDRNAKLDALKAGPQPTALVPLKIYRLLKMGYNRFALSLGIDRLGDHPWSTTTHEQGHGSSAVVHRAHPQYATTLLTACAMVHCCRALFQQPPLDSTLRKAQAALARLDRSMPSKAYGRNVFFRDLCAAVALKQPDGKLSKNGRVLVMRTHAKKFGMLSPARQQAYCAKAKEEAAKKLQDHQVDRLHFEGIVRLANERSHQDRLANGSRMKLSNCRFTEKDLEQLAIMWNTWGKYSRADVEQMRAKSVDPPKPPALTVQSQFAAIDLPTPPALTQPRWCLTVCRHRDNFKKCVIVVDGPAGKEAFLFLFAHLNPLLCGFLRVVLAEQVLPCVSSMAMSDIISASLTVFRHQFQPRWGEYVLGHEVTTGEVADVFVVPGIHLRGDMYVSNGVMWSLDDWVDDLPHVKLQNQQPTKRVPAHTEPELVKYRWLASYMAPASSQGASGSGSGSSGGGGAQASTKVADVDEDLVDQAFLDLEDLREEHRQGMDLDGDDFNCNVIGGAWTAANKGVAGDRVKVWAGSAEVKQFCDDYHLPREASYSRRKYTPRGASAVAQLWCRRMQHFYNVYMCSSDTKYKFSEIDIDSAPNQFERGDSLEDLPEGHVALVKMAEVLSIAPRG